MSVQDDQAKDDGQERQAAKQINREERQEAAHHVMKGGMDLMGSLRL